MKKVSSFFILAILFPLIACRADDKTADTQIDVEPPYATVKKVPMIHLTNTALVNPTSTTISTTVEQNRRSNKKSHPHVVKIIDSLEKPVFMTAPKNSTDYLYFLEKEGRIMLYDRKTKEINPEPFLDIRDKIEIKMNEQGLLGMAFSPNFKSNHTFFLYYTDTQGDTKVSRFTGKKNEPGVNEEVLISVKQDFRNHNGGWIGFGPDGYLYIALGDGGAGNDPKQRAQDKAQLLGKLLRIDVSAKSGYTIPKDNPFLKKSGNRKEIYAYGLRNPWRCSWDKKTKVFYIADVGQNNWEEINAVTQRQLKGANFGWRKREAKHSTPKKKVGGNKPRGAIDPIFEYDHSHGRSITGGYVYRGKIKSLHGQYFFADFVTPLIWSIKYNGRKASKHKDWSDKFMDGDRQIRSVSSFAVDPQGEMYLISHSGNVYVIVE